MAIDWNSDCEVIGSDVKSTGEGSQSGGSNGGGGGGGIDARERHKLAERERRKSMRELFLSLHSLLPHANTVRKEQSAILDEIIKYIPIAAARLRSLQNRKNSSSPLMNLNRSKSNSTSKSNSSPSIQVSDRTTTSNSSNSISCLNTSDCDIRVAPEPSSSVAIRVRGDRVNVSLSDTKGTSQTLLLSAILDELEAHQLELVRSTHCRDGSKVLHHSESKICEGLDRSPVLLKARLQELARKLHKLRKSSTLKRSFDQI
uniref:BHLH transcription factor n=1 Tax=Eschscholzia californica TaxID=3467 RepID=A0A024FCG3_ESCCA|nr:bHLH transcription factor [Eschscholzia californica]